MGLILQQSPRICTLPFVAVWDRFLTCRDRLKTCPTHLPSRPGFFTMCVIPLANRRLRWTRSWRKSWEIPARVRGGVHRAAWVRGRIQRGEVLADHDGGGAVLPAAVASGRARQRAIAADSRRFGRCCAAGVWPCATLLLCPRRRQFSPVRRPFRELNTWLPGRADYRERPSPEKLRSAMGVLAQFHRAAETFRGLPAHEGSSPGIQRRMEQLAGWRTTGASQLAACVRPGVCPGLETRASGSCKVSTSGRAMLPCYWGMLPRFRCRFSNASATSGTTMCCLRAPGKRYHRFRRDADRLCRCGCRPALGEPGRE